MDNGGSFTWCYIQSAAQVGCTPQGANWDFCKPGVSDYTTLLPTGARAARFPAVMPAVPLTPAAPRRQARASTRTTSTARTGWP